MSAQKRLQGRHARVRFAIKSFSSAASSQSSGSEALNCVEKASVEGRTLQGRMFLRQHVLEMEMVECPDATTSSA